MPARIALALVALACLAGCASTRPYSSDAAANLTVHSTIEHDVSAALHIHGVGKGCATEYRGSIDLDRPVTEIGLPPGSPAYLVVSFDTSSFFGGSRSSSVGTLVTPRAGQRYELFVSYRDDVYDVSLREAGIRGRPGRELPRRELSACGGG